MRLPLRTLKASYHTLCTGPATIVDASALYSLTFDMF